MKFKNVKNPFEKGLSGKLGKTAETLAEARKQIIVTAITAVACLVCIGIASFASSIFTESGADSVKEMNCIQNEMDQFKKTDEAFTGIGEIQTAENVRVEWTGTKLDMGRWSTDEATFWKWIRPAFNYDSATEYNKAREEFVSTKGLGKCLFTVQFLAPYDTEEAARKKYADSLGDDGKPTAVQIANIDAEYKCTASENEFDTWPIGELSDGSYRYMARLNFSPPGTMTGGRTIVFMYTVRHTTGQNGGDIMTILDFECWPPQ